MADLCVDEYTDHGHCGILDGPDDDPETSVDNDATLEIYGRIAVALHWTLAVLLTAAAGLGFYIINASGAFNVNGIWTGVIMIVALIGVLTTLIGMAERRMLRWLPDHGSGPAGL